MSLPWAQPCHVQQTHRTHDVVPLLSSVRTHLLQVDCFSYGVVLWEIITKERSQRGNWRQVRVPEECPAEVNALLQVSNSTPWPMLYCRLQCRQTFQT